MKKIIATMLMCLMLIPAYAEETTVEESVGPAVYEYAEGDLYTVSPERYVDFDGLFTIQLPEKWQRYVLDEEQTAEGVFVCFGDGETFVTVKRADDTGEYADMEAYALYLQEQGGYPNAFVSTFGGTEQPNLIDDALEEEGTEFVLYNDPEASRAMCATIIPGGGIYTFTFSPIAADMDAGQLILDMMESFEPVDPDAEPTSAPSAEASAEPTEEAAE